MQKRSKAAAFLPYILFGAMAALLAARAFYGFDWSDETYYAALPYRFVLGDRPFIDSWDIHQTSAMILFPVVWAYFRLHGSMDGILLFLRLLFVAFQAAVAIYMFKVLLDGYGKTAAILSALLYMAFAPFSIATFSYNTMGYSFALLCSVTILYSIKMRRKRLLLWLAGVWCSLAAIAYPFFIALLPVYAAFSFLPSCERAEGRGEGKPVSNVLMFACGCATVALLFSSALLLATGAGGIAGNIKYLFMDPQHKSSGILTAVASFVREYWSQAFLPEVQAAALTVALTMALKKRINTVVARSAVLLAAVLTVLAGSARTLFSGGQPDIIKINGLFLNIGLWPLTVYLLKPSRKSLHLVLLLWLPANVMCACVYYSSNTRMNGAPYALLLSAIAAILLFAGAAEEGQRAIQGAGGKFGSSFPAFARRCGFALASALVAAVLLLRITTVYRDGALPMLSTRLTTGPAQGLYTTAEKARDYEGIMEDIRGYAPGGGEVLFTRLLPFGYLCTSLRPYPPSLWRTPLTDERLNLMMNLYPADRPGYLYIIKDQYGFYTAEDPIQGALVDYFKANGAKMIESEYAYKFVLNR